VPPLGLTPTQRLQVLRSLRQEYSNRLTHLLQGRAPLALELHERTDMVASAAGLVFHHTDTATEYPLPPSTSIIQVYDQTQRGLLLLGAPGSGKSTLVLHLAVELIQRAEDDAMRVTDRLRESWGELEIRGVSLRAIHQEV
jgi:predicted NACHT family NTPase